jgi:hypothetical protein
LAGTIMCDCQYKLNPKTAINIISKKINKPVIISDLHS